MTGSQMLVIALCAEYLHRLPSEVRGSRKELAMLGAYDRLKREEMERMR